MYGDQVVQQVDIAFYYIAGFALLFLFGITVTMLYFVWRYDAKRHPVAREIRGNVWLEVVWTVIPSLIALSMFYVGWEAFIALRSVPKDAISIRTEAEMYRWQFYYPSGKHTIAEMVVPVNQAVKIELTSKDVLHSLFIPAFRIKIDSAPKMTTYAWFKAEKIGNYDIYCAEYCGSGHADMRATLRVVSATDFAAWVSEQPKPKENEDEDYR